MRHSSDSGRPTVAALSCSAKLVPINHGPPTGGEREDIMQAREHTHTMLRWWWKVGITIADLAVRRRDGTMVWHHETPLDQQERLS
jgi:hypothetical protein